MRIAVAATPTPGNTNVTTRQYEFVETHQADGVLTLLINRPEVRNALHPPACVEMGRCLDAAERDPEIRVVIIGSKGQQAFCAGFDLQWAQQHPQVYQDPLVASEIVRRPSRSKPFIAAVEGLAMGLGFELALACDLIVASPGAQFALPEPQVGLAAMGGGVVRLARQLSLKQALGITLTSRRVSAEEGARLGFVNEVATGPVLDCARQWAELILSAGPLSIAATMQMAEAATSMPLEAALDPRQHPAVMAVLDSEDAHEGRQAFLERRKPRWQGR